MIHFRRSMSRRTLLGGAGAWFALRAGAAEKSVADAPFRLDVGGQLPDPYLFRWEANYYLIGTRSNGRPGVTGFAFELFRSADLIRWESLGSVLRIPEYEGSRKANYWAPEIVVLEGVFYLHYTSDAFGDPYRRYVRVATADKIEGPYRDSGGTLSHEPSIDSHVAGASVDERFLFYTGNEGNPQVGQLLVDRMISPTVTAGEPRRVFPGRKVPWEEGGCVVSVGDRYVLFTSQGNWRDGSYHVLAAEASNVGGPYRRLRRGNGEDAVVRSRPGQLGPGHNSVFQGPGDRLYLAYHAWDETHTGRYPWIAPLEWDDGFPFVR